MHSSSHASCYAWANGNNMATDGIDIPIPIPIPKSLYYSPSVGGSYRDYFSSSSSPELRASGGR